jgi:hypothetical protein
MTKSNNKLLGIMPKLALTPVLAFVMANSTLTMAGIGDQFGYEIAGDISTGDLHCIIGTATQTSDASMYDLKALTGMEKDDLFHKYALARSWTNDYDEDNNYYKNPIEFHINDYKTSIFHNLRKENPKSIITSVMKHTRVVGCHIVNTPYLKKATILDSSADQKRSLQFEFSWATNANNSSSYATSVSRNSESSIEASGSIGFTYKGVTGGATVTRTSTQSESTTTSKGNENSSGTSTGSTISESYEIPAGWYGYAPDATWGKQVVVTFQTTFSGYVGIRSKKKIDSHNDLGAGIGSVLSRIHLPSTLTTTYTQYLNKQSPLAPHYQLYTESSADPRRTRAAFNANQKALRIQGVENIGPGRK